MGRSVSAGARSGWPGLALLLAASVTFLSYRASAQSIQPPQFEPQGGFTDPVALEVVISSPTPGAVIRYRTNGTLPIPSDPASSSPVTVTISRTTTLTASAWIGSSSSAVTSATYAITGWVSAGNKHSVALLADGTVWTWGENGTGHLGDGTLINRPEPGAVPGLANVIALSAGENHTLAIRKDTAPGAPQDRGFVWGWGHNGSGRLGDGTTTTGKSPVQVLTAPNTPLGNIVAVSAGATHSLALDADGRIWAWGDNTSGRLGLGSGFAGSHSTYAKLVPALENVVAIAAGGTHSLALTEDPSTQERKVYAWGSNANGRLGTGSTSPSSSSSPVMVSLPSKPGTSQKVVIESIEAGDAHCLALDADGLAYAWGSNPGSRLGVGSSAGSITAPARVTELPGNSQFVMLAAGETFSMALDDAGGVWVWGDNESGQFGNDSTADTGAVNVTLDRPATVIAAGNRHALAVLDDGLVAVWGNNQYGQLGIGITLYSSAPEQIAELSVISGAIAAGTSHSFALDGSGALNAWGDNTYGQLGIGSSISKLSPVEVSLPGALAISAGDRHSLAIMIDTEGVSQLYAWGNGTNGKLGLGSDLANRPAPVKANLPNVVAISAGNAHSLAITELQGQRKLYAWGSNGSSRLGDGTTTQQVSPKQITVDNNGVALPPLTSVAAADSHSLAVTASNTVLGWGSNSSGRLGNGLTSGTTSRPALIPSLNNVTAVAAGSAHSLALQSNGVVLAWGNNGSGRLGDGTSNTRSLPVQVLTAAGGPLTTATAIAAGGTHSLALDADGSVWSWGDNAYGQLGDNSLATSKYAAKVPGLSGVIAIAAGDQHSMALTSNGTVFTWGYNNAGQLGNDVAGYLPYPAHTAGDLRLVEQLEGTPGTDGSGGFPDTTDSDRNGLPDAWEIEYFGAVGADLAGDADADGLTNFQEFQNGTNPGMKDNGSVKLQVSVLVR